MYFLLYTISVFLVFLKGIEQIAEKNSLELFHNLPTAIGE